MRADTVWLLEATPRNPATGAIVTVRLAGGGTRGYRQFGHAEWRAGLERPPAFVQRLGFEDGEFGVGAVPQAAELRWGGTAKRASSLAALYWPDAEFTLRSGPDGGADSAYALVLSGRFADVVSEPARLTLKMADPSVILARPVLGGATFTGAGGIEGIAELKGRPKRRGVGRCRNVELWSLDPANNIWVATDPAKALLAIDQVYDRGNAASGLVQVAWAGSIVATLAALAAAACPQGGAAVAPSIACIKWWFAQPGKLTCDLRGENSAGYIDRPADIAAWTAAAVSGPAVNAASLNSARALRDVVSGLLVSDEASAATVITDVLAGVSLWWGMTAAGEMEFGPWGFGASGGTINATSVRRVKTHRPIKKMTIGYRRNNHVMTRGDIAAVVLDAAYSDGTPIDDLRPATAGATRNVNRGNWSGAGVAYSLGDIVQRNGSSYAVEAQHISAAGNGPPGANWSLFAAAGLDGSDGTPGQTGGNGNTSYIHFAYANSANGVTDFTTGAANGRFYIGTYSDFTAADSNNPAVYTWSLFRGSDGNNGTPGAPGASGQATYVHIAYATSATGSTGFSTTDGAGKTYIGTYTDGILADSTNPALYTWSLIKGERGEPGLDGDGIPGTPGTNGQTSYVHFAYANSANGATDFTTGDAGGRYYIGTYTDFIAADSANPASYTWSLFRGADGANGTPGAPGTNGQATYVHIAYATSATGSTGFSTTDGAGKTYIGTYTDQTLADSANPALYTWSLIKGADGANGTPGAPGANGQATYVHIAYATSATGSTGFSTTDGAGKTYIGTYTDQTLADSTNPALYSWSLIRGADGNNGAPGAPGVDGYIADTETPAFIIPCFSNGTPKASWTGGSGTIKLTKGGTVITSGVTYSFANPTSMATLALIGNAFTFAGLTADAGSFDIVATYAGTNYVRRVTAKKVMDGSAAFRGSVAISGSGSYSSASDVASATTPIPGGSTIQISASIAYSIASFTEDTFRGVLSLYYQNVTDGGPLTLLGSVTGSYATRVNNGTQQEPEYVNSSGVVSAAFSFAGHASDKNYLYLARLGGSPGASGTASIGGNLKIEVIA